MHTLVWQSFRKDAGVSWTTCWILSLVFMYSRNRFIKTRKWSAFLMLPGTHSVIEKNYSSNKKSNRLEYRSSHCWSETIFICMQCSKHKEVIFLLHLRRQSHILWIQTSVIHIIQYKYLSYCWHKLDKTNTTVLNKTSICLIPYIRELLHSLLGQAGIRSQSWYGLPW